LHVNNINHIETVEFSPTTREDTSKAISLFNKLINRKNNKKRNLGSENGEQRWQRTKYYGGPYEEKINRKLS